MGRLAAPSVRARPRATNDVYPDRRNPFDDGRRHQVATAPTIRLPPARPWASCPAAPPWPSSRGPFVILVLVDRGRPPGGQGHPGHRSPTRRPRPCAPAPAGRSCRPWPVCQRTVFDAVGAPPVVPGQALLTGQPALSIGGRPAVVYVGAEFCPYCAAERWALVAALDASGQARSPTSGATSSSSDEVFPGRPDLLLRRRPPTAAATSRFRVGRGVRGQTLERQRRPACSPSLHDPTPLEWALLRRYDTAPFVPGRPTPSRSSA